VSSPAKLRVRPLTFYTEREPVLQEVNGEIPFSDIPKKSKPYRMRYDHEGKVTDQLDTGEYLSD